MRALEHQPEVLLLDEPTGPHDDESTAAVEGLLREKQSNGLALFWVTHDNRQAARVATRQFWLDRGRLREAVLEAAARSAAHTSELQSLMRHSYAVYCLTKK